MKHKIGCISSISFFCMVDYKISRPDHSSSDVPDFKKVWYQDAVYRRQRTYRRKLECAKKILL